MKPVERASNFEFWFGRGRSFRTSRFRRGSVRVPPLAWRPLAAAALIAVLAGAWLIVGRHGGSPVNAVAPAPVAPTMVAPTTVAAPRRPPAPTVPVGHDCRALSDAHREVRCVIDAVDVDVRLFAPARVGAAYRRASGAAVAARSGSPACARGAPDERAWSAVAAPVDAIGRYRCRFEHGRAAMWWTNGERLVHAVARDGNLAGLFAWWRTHRVE